MAVLVQPENSVLLMREFAKVNPCPWPAWSDAPESITKAWERSGTLSEFIEHKVRTRRGGVLSNASSGESHLSGETLAGR